jgi:hypothetical protein
LSAEPASISAAVCSRRILAITIKVKVPAKAGGEDCAVAAVAGVRVETVELDAVGTRQISSRHRTTTALQERRGDIEAAVNEACQIVQESVANVDARHGWQVSTVEAKFGLTLAAEAGVIISRASAEASFEVTITIERARG